MRPSGPSATAASHAGPAAPAAEDPEGLSQAEAARRLAVEGPNALPVAGRRTVASIIRSAAREPMFALLFAGGVLYLLLGEPREGTLLFSLVLAILALALYQEDKTERALAALRELSSPAARVIRGGVPICVDSREVVRGDLCMVHEGDRVPADGFLLAASALRVDESMLTGESVPVDKQACPAGQSEHAAPAQLLFAGTNIVQGHGLLRVTATGPASAIGRIGQSLQALPSAPSPLQRQVGTLVRLFAVAGAFISIALVLFYVARGGGWLQGLLAGIALALALLPQEFAVVLTVFPALGAWRLAQAKVLTRRIAAIETLGATSVLCVDKTGTLTENSMRVAALYAQGAVHAVHAEQQGLPEHLHALVEFALLASPSDSADPMDKAVQHLGQRVLAATEHLHPAWSRAREYAITPALRAVTHAWLPGDGGRATVAAKGAPEAILDLCHLGPERSVALLATADAMAADGLRVLAVATASFPGPPWPELAHDFDFVFIGLIGFADPLRPGVPAAVQECRDAGIRVIMITGDYPATARSIARQAGIGDGDPVTGDELAALGPDALSARLRETSVCARVAPEQKLAIVQALREGGAIVAMTGDGVNDAPALRAAHVGVAMGQRGTDVARQAAALVLLDDRFTSIVKGVRLGRQIYDNLRKAMIYVISVHVPTAAMALLPVLLGWPILLYPIHIVFLELLIGPTCALAFENEPAEPDLMRRRPRNPASPLLATGTLAYGLLQGLVALAAVLAVYGIALEELPEQQARSAAFAALVLADIGLILVNRSPVLTGLGSLLRPNRTLWGVAGAALAALLAAVYVAPLAGLFYFAPIAPAVFAQACLAGIGSVLVFDLFKLVRRRARMAAPKHRQE